MKHPSLTVLKWLLEGNEIDDNGYKVSLQEQEDGKSVLCCRAEVQENGVKKPDKYLEYPMSFSEFIDYCKNLKQEDIIIMGANNALNSFTKGKI